MVADVRSELDALIQRHGEDYASISRLIGRNPAYIQQFIKRGTPQKLAEDDRLRLASYFGVPDERLGGKPAAAVRVANADMMLIPRMDVRASAGPGGLADIEQAALPVAFDRSLLGSVSARGSAGLSVIRVSGDSMQPTLDDGDDILVDRGDGVGRLREGIYVLRVEDLLVVKRLILRAGEGHPFVIRSDNPRYPDMLDYDPASLTIVGRVVWMGRRLR